MVPVCKDTQFLFNERKHSKLSKSLSLSDEPLIIYTICFEFNCVEIKNLTLVNASAFVSKFGSAT